ncbi:hypothetical protein COB11_05225 [Candidatus Aerophobetes bacterium]|uniref:Nudix hydrolase domain-containing protein n=1 Tax=Aerophobetes bacterium TaxID=2030807 RepID=A0A2A4YF90_UNCAE|nr:MAG: hypothetical protein COB11_05225 [Candidatus Aerophobetes bacterium]
MNEDCFHLGLKALIRNKEGLFLILRAKNYWDIPGGRIHKEEPLLNALKREVFEETGIYQFLKIEPIQLSLSNIRITTSSYDVGLIHYFYFCEVKDPSVTLSDEHISYEWSSMEQLIERLAQEAPKELLEKLSHYEAKTTS